MTRRAALHLLSPPDFQTLFQSAPGLYLVLSPDLVIIAASDAYLHATMTRREDIVGRHLFEVFPDNPADPGATGVANLEASLRRVIAQRIPDVMAVQKYDVRRPESEGDGFEERYWSSVNSPVLDERGRLIYIIHRVEDVTDFLRLRERGSERDRLARDLETKAGRMEAEVYRRAQQIQKVNQELLELRDRLEQRVEERTGDLRRANDELRREVDERRRAEEALRRSEAQLLQAQKLEAVGRLAGGIAHDFNNLLSVILSYSEELLSAIPAGEAHDKLAEIERAGQRAAELTRQLLVFSRQQVTDLAVLDLNQVLTGVSTMLRRMLREDVALRVVPAARLGVVRADRGQIEQVIMNLAVNARDAMPNGGLLKLETADVDLDDSYAGDHIGVTPGPYVMLAVSDTGHGMDAATQARVFEPFFTTKERGKGTGLGLSTVFGIVQQSGGTIWLYSEPGRGSTFKIFLPRVAGVAAPSAETDRSSSIPRGTETVLLVEDQDEVRRVARTILERFGYRVVEASDAGEALGLARQEQFAIDLLLTDVVMPGMDGRQLADRVLEARPGLKVLFMSGYTDDVILHHGVLDSGVAYIQKPLTPESLARKVRQVLDQV
jgi:signal transduction histidine kinase